MKNKTLEKLLKTIDVNAIKTNDIFVLNDTLASKLYGGTTNTICNNTSCNDGSTNGGCENQVCDIGRGGSSNDVCMNGVCTKDRACM